MMEEDLPPQAWLGLSTLLNIHLRYLNPQATLLFHPRASTKARSNNSTMVQVSSDWSILSNGSVLLQNVVVSLNECSQERIQFWSRFVDIYYKTSGGSVRYLKVLISHKYSS